MDEERCCFGTIAPWPCASQALANVVWECARRPGVMICAFGWFEHGFLDQR